MKTTKLTLILILLFAVGSATEFSAQSWLERLGKRAENTAKRKVERKVEEKVDKAVDRAFDKTEEEIKKSSQKKEAYEDDPVMEKTSQKEPRQKRGKQKTVNENFEIIEEDVTDEYSLPPALPGDVQNISDWENGEPFYALKKGGVVEYTNYDGKGRVSSYVKNKVIEMQRHGRNITAVLAGTETNAKGKELGSATLSLRFQNGSFYVDLLSMMPPKGLENADFDAKITGREMMIPEKLAPGQVLPEAEMQFNIKMKGDGDSMALPPIVVRVFNRKAIGAESVETPIGKFVCFKINQSVEMELPLIGKQVSSGTVWIGKGMGVVKSVSYDKKGKLQGTTLLTNLE